ncbi:hypothetical protein PVAG01_03085 [Phlyctema vagabunda]|uniref:Uncharacterized protein n=1 Tax=Phlyctema vagabunda TaxID=108571 RepID=A0ABR4PSQ1_9HELO
MIVDDPRIDDWSDMMLRSSIVPYHDEIWSICFIACSAIRSSTTRLECEFLAGHNGRVRKGGTSEGSGSDIGTNLISLLLSLTTIGIYRNSRRCGRAVAEKSTVIESTHSNYFVFARAKL